MVGLNFSISDIRADAQRERNTPLEMYIRQIDYLVERLGIDSVGFGSDFDCTRISQEIGDVTGLPKLIAALREHGYDEVALKKITHENWVRVLGKTWQASGKSNTWSGAPKCAASLCLFNTTDPVPLLLYRSDDSTRHRMVDPSLARLVRHGWHCWASDELPPGASIRAC